MPETKELVSIFDDRINFNVKHPLQCRWTLWYDDATMLKANPKLTWDENLKQVLTIESIEDFWGLFMHLKNPADIPQAANYHLFKEGIKPAWEDPENQRGGKWTSTYPKQARGGILNKAWFDTISAVLGEQFEHGDDITGIVISIRKMGDRIAIWTKSCDDREKTMKTGLEFKKIIAENYSDKLLFQAHVDSSVKNSSATKTTYSC